MHILLLEDVVGGLAPLRKLLAVGGHDIALVTNAEQARVAIANQKPDIAVVAWKPAMGTLHEIARILRAADDPVYRSVLAIVEDNTSEARHAAYEAGADDVAMFDASARELADHVGSAARIVRLERRLRERIVELDGALRRVAVQGPPRAPDAAGKTPGLNGGLGVLLTNAWVGLEDILTKACSEFIQQPVEPMAGAPVRVSASFAARVSLSDVENERKLELTFLSSPEAARFIAASLCGAEAAREPEVVRDVVLELVNTGMGAVRAAFLGEKVGFAASIPEPVTPGDPTLLLRGAEAKRLIQFCCPDGSAFQVIVTVRGQGRARIVGARLREGMVIATDVKSEAGILLVRAGTRLTETAALKLCRLVPKMEVELAEAG